MVHEASISAVHGSRPATAAMSGAGPAHAVVLGNVEDHPSLAVSTPPSASAHTQSAGHAAAPARAAALGETRAPAKSASLASPAARAATSAPAALAMGRACPAVAAAIAGAAVIPGPDLDLDGVDMAALQRELAALLARMADQDSELERQRELNAELRSLYQTQVELNMASGVDEELLSLEAETRAVETRVKGYSYEEQKVIVQRLVDAVRAWSYLTFLPLIC